MVIVGVVPPADVFGSAYAENGRHNRTPSGPLPTRHSHSSSASIILKADAGGVDVTRRTAAARLEFCEVPQRRLNGIAAGCWC